MANENVIVRHFLPCRCWCVYLAMDEMEDDAAAAEPDGPS